jgi:DNA-binding transcriptional LysR family regulator
MWEHVELQEIRVFLTVCDELHFGRAGDELRLSRSRVSQIVLHLEARLGARLFDRNSRRVSITPEGERLREEVGPRYQELPDALRTFYDGAQMVSGELPLGLLFPSSGGQKLPIEQSDLIAGPILASDERILAVSVDHPLAGRDSISVEDLADYQAHDAGNKLPREYLDTLIPLQHAQRPSDPSPTHRYAFAQPRVDHRRPRGDRAPDDQFFPRTFQASRGHLHPAPRPAADERRTCLAQSRRNTSSPCLRVRGYRHLRYQYG